MKILLLFAVFLISIPVKSEQTKYIVVEENNKKGLVNEKGEFLIPAIYEDLGWSKGLPTVMDNVLGFKKGHLWGLINIKNERLVEPIYAAIYPAGNKYLIAARFNQFSNEISYGMINSSGTVLISFKYYTLDYQVDHVIASLKSDRLSFGILSEREKPLIPVQYQKIEKLNDKAYSIKNFENKVAYFDLSSGYVSPFLYDSIAKADDQYLVVLKGGKQGLMNVDGRLLVAPEYKKITLNGDRSVKVLPFTSWHILNNKNELQKTFFFDEIEAVAPETYKVGIGENEALVDKEGGLISDFYDCKIGEFVNEHAVISYKNKYGVINKLGYVLVPIVYDSIIISKRYFFVNNILNRKALWSILDLEGNQINGPEYHDVRQLNQQLFAVKVNHYWGLAASNGKSITTCKFDSLVLQDDGNIKAHYLEKEGVLNPNGEWVILPNNSKVTYINPNLYITSDPFCNNILRKSGKDVYCSQGNISKRGNDLLEVTTEGKMGLLNLDGEVLLDARHDYVSELQKDSIYVFNKEGLYGIMTKSGRILCENNAFEAVYPLKEDFLGVKINDKYGFIDVNGKLRIANRYDSISSFSEGMSAVKLIGKWGFINKLERLKVQPQYDEVQDFQDGLAIVNKSGKVGLIDTEGNVVLPLDFDDLKKIQNGRYISRKDGKYGLIGKDGKQLVFPKYEEIQDLKNGFLIIQRRGKYGMGSVDGEMIIPFIYETIIFDKYNNVFLAAQQPEWKVINLNP